MQMRKVYAWEKLAYPGFWTDDHLTPAEVRVMVHRVLNDVRAGGGKTCDPRLVEIRFNKRSASGSASWGRVNLNPKKVTLALLLHEIAHMLTWGAPVFDPIVSCKEGHGANFVGCFIALMERYADRPVGPAVQTALMFQMPGKPKRGALIRTETLSRGRTRFVYEAIPTTTFASIQVSTRALDHWRALFASLEHPELRRCA
jgi:hypothetical protein